MINLQGRVYMAHTDCPFRKADEMLAALPADVKVRFIDFHAEVTSEKMAMGWYVDGRVSAIVGTHTHIPTADTRILPGGTAYQTDCGMTGPYDSVIGVEKDRCYTNSSRRCRCGWNRRRARSNCTRSSSRWTNDRQGGRVRRHTLKRRLT